MSIRSSSFNLFFRRRKNDDFIDDEDSNSSSDRPTHVCFSMPQTRNFPFGDASVVPIMELPTGMKEAFSNGTYEPTYRVMRKEGLPGSGIRVTVMHVGKYCTYALVFLLPVFDFTFFKGP